MNALGGVQMRSRSRARSTRTNTFKNRGGLALVRSRCMLPSNQSMDPALTLPSQNDILSYAKEQAE
jgi:hypothetical protein